MCNQAKHHSRAAAGVSQNNEYDSCMHHFNVQNLTSLPYSHPASTSPLHKNAQFREGIEIYANCRALSKVLYSLKLFPYTPIKFHMNFAIDFCGNRIGLSTEMLSKSQLFSAIPFPLTPCSSALSSLRDQALRQYSLNPNSSE